MMYRYTENEVPTVSSSKVIARTDTQIHRQDRWTDTQTDLSEIITYPHTRMVITTVVNT